MLTLLFKIPFYHLFRNSLYPILLPLSLSIDITHKCNSKCKTCGIWLKNDELKELSLDEYVKIFTSIPHRIYWINFSGGEPFLRNDIFEILYHSCKCLTPLFLNITTNGLEQDKIINTVNKLSNLFKAIKFKINISIDGIGEDNDKIRGIKGCYNTSIETLKILKSFKRPNISIGTSTTISDYNIDKIQSIIEELSKLSIDEMVFEIAQKRDGLYNHHLNFQVDNLKLKEIIPIFKKKLKYKNKLLKILRQIYYAEIASEIREKENKEKTKLFKTQNHYKCFASFAFSNIMPDGEVWPCPVKERSMGNLKDFKYSFIELWKSKKAQKVREEIRVSNCSCLLAYSYMINKVISPLNKISAYL